jgi:autophagy-related protein 13
LTIKTARRINGYVSLLPLQIVRVLTRQFNIIIPEADIYKADLQLYKSISSFPSTPDGASTVPPLLVAFILDTSDLPSNQALMWHRDSGKVTLDTGKLGGKGKGKERKGSGIVLERWTFEAKYVTAPLRMRHALTFSNASIHPSASQIASHTAYRMGIIHFRSLFALVRLLPAYKLYRRLRRANNGLRLGLKVWSPEGYPRDEAGLREAWEVMEQDLISLDTGLDTLVTAPDVERDQDSQRYELPSLDLFGVEYRLSVDFRPDVDFHVDDLESVLSEKLVDMEEDWFTPTVARHRMDETSSNPSSSATSSNPPSRRVGTPTTIPSSNPAPIPQRQGPASIGSFQTGALPGSRNRQASAQSQKGTDAVNERWGAIGEGLPFATATGGDNRVSCPSIGQTATTDSRRLLGPLYPERQ